MLKCDAMPTIVNVQDDTLKEKVKCHKKIVSKGCFIFYIVNCGIRVFSTD